MTNKEKSMGYDIESLNKIIRYMEEDTIIEYPQQLISDCGNFISYSSGDILFPFLPKLYRPSWWVSFDLVSGEKTFSYFSLYCIKNYGLTNDEVDYEWSKYFYIVPDIISRLLLSDRTVQSPRPL